MNPFGILPYLAAALAVFGAGFSSAWYVQGLRVTSLKQEIKEWQQAQKDSVLAAREHDANVNKETIDAWETSTKALADHYRRNPVVRLLQPAAGRDGGAPSAPAGTVDGPASDPLPDPRAVAAFAEACGETTLQLLTLQVWVINMTKE